MTAISQQATTLLAELKELRSKLELGAVARVEGKLSHEDAARYDDRLDSYLRKRDDAVFLLLKYFADGETDGLD